MNYSRTGEPMGWKGRVAFSAATAIFFLLCHGLFGASHTVGLAALPTDEPGVGSHAVHHADGGAHGGSHHGEAHHSGEAPSNGDHGFAYAAVLVAGLALLAFALPIFGAIFARIESLAANRRDKVSHHFSLISCRGPTLPALQVFRL